VALKKRIIFEVANKKCQERACLAAQSDRACEIFYFQEFTFRLPVNRQVNDLISRQKNEEIGIFL